MPSILKPKSICKSLLLPALHRQGSNLQPLSEVICLEIGSPIQPFKMLGHTFRIKFRKAQIVMCNLLWRFCLQLSVGLEVALALDTCRTACPLSPSLRASDSYLLFLVDLFCSHLRSKLEWGGLN
jgi:hypothetical protein